MVVFMIAGHTCSPSLSSMASSSSDSSSSSSSSKSSSSSSSADSFDKERKTETQVILRAQCHLHGGFPKAEVVCGGWHAQRGTAASKRGHDYEWVISTLLLVVCECSRLLSPNAAANGGREVGVFVRYCQSVVCRLNKRTSYTDYILAKKVTCHLVTYLKWPSYIFPLNAMPNLPRKQLCVKYLRVTVIYRVKQWNPLPTPRTPPPPPPPNSFYWNFSFVRPEVVWMERDKDVIEFLSG